MYGLFLSLASNQKISMKTTLYAALLMLIVSVSACKKDTYTCKSPCTDCEKVNEGDVRICRQDYNSDNEYGLVQDVYEAQGYDCSTGTPSDTEIADSDDERRDLEEEGYVCTAD